MSSTAVFFPGMNPQKRKHSLREVSPMRVSEDFMLLNPDLFKHEALEKIKQYKQYKQDKQEAPTRKSKSRGKTRKARKQKRKRAVRSHKKRQFPRKKIVM